jgi:hypothetical protein
MIAKEARINTSTFPKTEIIGTVHLFISMQRTLLFLNQQFDHLQLQTVVDRTDIFFRTRIHIQGLPIRRIRIRIH